MLFVQLFHNNQLYKEEIINYFKAKINVILTPIN